MKGMNEHIRKMIEPGSPQAVLFFGILGLCIALLFLLLGFWRTVLLILCCLSGCLIGGIKDKAGILRRLANRLYKGRG
jgi:uncharacterized membrane protein